MKRFHLIVLIFLLIAFVATACAKQPAGSAATAPPEPTASPTPAAPTPAPPTPAPAITFTDKQLEGKIRDILNKPEGDITLEDAAAVTALDLSNESFDGMNLRDGGIKDISDLEYFVNLKDLNLSFNDITDFSPLAKLTKLESLGFTGVRPKDLSPLKGLTNLVCLVFDWSYAPDQGHDGYESLDFMADMKNLEIFEAKGAGIKDITALGGLTKLWSVFLERNLITDISPLANLTNLKDLLLSDNPITDFSPIKDIYPQLGAKDFEME